MNCSSQIKRCGIGMLLGSALVSGAMEQVWTYTSGTLPEAWNGVQLQLDKTVQTPAGAPALKVSSSYNASELRWPPFLLFPSRGEHVVPGARVTIRFCAKASRPQKIRLICCAHAPLSDRYAETKDFPLTTQWREIVYQSSFYDRNPEPLVNIPRLGLPAVNREDRIWLGPVTVEISPGQPVAKKKVRLAVTQPGQWAPIATSDLYVKPKSALDFSGFVDRAPAGSFGRLKVNNRGQLYFEKKPEEPVRFLAAQLIPNWLPAMEKKEIEEYAAAVARQGYNLVRLHFIDQVLQCTSRGAALKAAGTTERYRLPETEEQIHFDPVALDRFDYLIAQLRRNGVYVNLDAMTSYIGYDGGKLSNPVRTGGYSTKVQMFVNPMFRKNWAAGVSRLFHHVNPYTGLKLKDDPALVLVCFLNEQDILLESRDYSIEFKPVWIDFLKRKYGSFQQLHKAWNGICGQTKIPENGSFDDVPGITYKTASGKSRAGQDMVECVGAMEQEMTDFFLETIREIGYPGLVTNWNMRTHIVSVPARAKLPAVSMNGYHAHPQKGIYTRGTEVNPASSVRSVGTSFKHQAVARFIDRPFFNTEFGFCFWNPYRHEQGLVFGAGAALQGWSSITCHSEQVTKHGRHMVPFAAGSDPVIRAAEAVEALAFLRGDVKTSNHLVEIPLDDAFIFQGGRALRGISDQLSRLWVLTGVGISYGPKRADVRPDLVVYPGRTSRLGGSDLFTSVENSVSTDQLAPVVQELRNKGILNRQNRTDLKRGIYQSDTGEIVLSTTGELTVIAPRLVGVTVKKDRKIHLGPVTLESCSIPAAFTVASLQKEKSIQESGRLLLILATDAINNNMQFKDSGRKTLENIGTLPVLLRTGKLSLSLRNVTSGVPRLYALALNGERQEEIPVERESGLLKITIDTAKLREPTPFFELVFERQPSIEKLP